MPREINPIEEEIIDIFPDRVPVFPLEQETTLQNVISRKVLRGTRIDNENVLGDKPVSTYARAINTAGQARDVVDLSITETKLANLAVATRAIQDDAVTATKVWRGGAVITLAAQIGTGIIGTAHIGSAQIVSAHIGSAQVNSAHIGSAQVGSAHIASLAVGTAQIADAAITTAKIGSLAVGTAQIADLAVSGVKIAGGAVTADKISVANLSAISANIGSITAGSLSAVTIAGSTITGGTIAIGSGNAIFRADASGIYLGNATFSLAPFRVDMAGAVVASNITITGGSVAGGLVTSGISATNITAGTLTGRRIQTLATVNRGIKIEVTPYGAIADSHIDFWDNTGGASIVYRHNPDGSFRIEGGDLVIHANFWTPTVGATLGRAGQGWGSLFLAPRAVNPANPGQIVNFSSGGVDQFRGQPGAGTWRGSFNMTAV